MATSIESERTVVFIEAPGKKRWFEKHISSLISNPLIFCTRGRLFDLGKLSMPGEVSLNVLDTWLPVVNRPAQEIADLAAVYKNIVIATDNDAEGDLIGSHIASFVSSSAQIYRLRLNALSKSDLQRAFINMKPFEYQNSGSLLTRCFDYTIGSEFSDPDLKIPASRVLLPALNSIKKYPMVTSILQGQKDNYWFDSACVNGKVHDIKIKDSTLLNTYELLTKGSVSTSMSPQVVSDAAQDLYEKGFLSYTRTSSGDASSETIGSLISSIWNSRHLPLDLDYVWPNVTDSHQAILPLRGIDGHLELASESESAVYRFVTLKTLDTLYRMTYEVETEYKDHVYHGNGISFPAGKHLLKGCRFVLKNPVDGSIIPCLTGFAVPRSYEYLTEGLAISFGNRTLGKEYNALRLLNGLNLTTPGQLLPQAKKLAMYLDEEIKLTPRGRVVLENGLRKVPDLCNISRVTKLNKYLHTQIEHPLSALMNSLRAVNALPKQLADDYAGLSSRDVRTKVNTDLESVRSKSIPQDLSYRPLMSFSR